MSDTDNLNYLKRTFTISGYHPRDKTLKSYILKYFITPAMTVLTILVVYNIRYMHENIFKLAEIFESLSTHGHVYGRQLVILKHAPLLEKIIENREQFWRYGKIFTKKMSRRNFIIKSLTMISVVMLSIWFARPIFDKNVDLPQKCWIPGGTKYSKAVIYFLQVICLTQSLSVAIIVDGTILLMGGEMEIQFDMLNKAIEKIKIGENCNEKHEQICFDQLKVCIVYHSFLLKQQEKMRKAFSEFFLLQFLLSIETLCIEIFVVNRAYTWNQFALGIIYVIGALMQCSFSFISASNLEFQAETLVDVVYNVDWYYSPTKKIPKLIVLMLMRAQKPLRFTGGGLFDVDRNMLLQIIRTGFSISAIIRHI